MSAQVDEVLKEVCLERAKRWEIWFWEIGVDRDHAHVLVQSVPMYSPTRIVQTVKSVTAREVFVKVPEVSMSAFPIAPSWIFTGGRGLAIWHIDDIVLTWCYSRPNDAENWKEFRSEGWKKAWTGANHYGISVIQADDRWDLERNYWAWGDSADLYPGTLGVTRFGNDTHPNSISYYFWPGSEPKYGLSGVTVDNIAEVNGVITATLSFAR